MKPILIRAFQWTLASFLVGLIVWLILGGLVWPVFFYDWTISDAISHFPFSLILGSYFAGAVGLVLSPIYFGLYTIFEKIAESKIWLKNTSIGLFITVLILALPPAIGIAYSFEEPILGEDFKWIEFGKTFMLTGIIFICAVLIPRLTLKKLKPTESAV
ncbi:MAG: hypothetical protein CL670_12890 [Balneola sp.]|jgi:hypothetical protein|nr:hypothetical protein [Balneola sp.]MBE80045.1 hypothetical protein [Balneola sp.]|tara:strand:- start:65 stop:541 length:477 start_codon:yes stop_codon:yes gene_type:complete